MSLKNLIIHVTSAEPCQLREKLHENNLFQRYYDGNEHTIENFVKISTRYYYYDIPHDDLRQMISHLQISKEGHICRVKIFPNGQCGNYRFD